MYNLLAQLTPLRRDLVSDGYDEALGLIQVDYPVIVHSYATGTRCWDWTIPEKWSLDWPILLANTEVSIRSVGAFDAMSYSLPFEGSLQPQELAAHLHTAPDAIPFEFKYYERDWGLCMSEAGAAALGEGTTYVRLETTFTPGYLRVGEWTIPGSKDDTIILCAHLDHPGQANDGASGVVVGLDVMAHLAQQRNEYTYKFLIVPETIGSIAYLSHHEELIPKFKGGIFLEMLGNDNDLALQQSRNPFSDICQAARAVTSRRIYPFRQLIVNDEMVWDSPTVGVPMISLSRFPYPEYHTSKDNMSIISEKRLAEARDMVLAILARMDAGARPKPLYRGLPFLSGHGLWVDWREQPELNKKIDEIIMLLDGKNSISNIASATRLPRSQVEAYLNRMEKAKLIAY